MNTSTSTPVTAKKRSEKFCLTVVFVTVLVDLIGFGIILPLLPLYGRRFGASPAEVAILFASYSAMQFIFAPLWGRLSDRVGRRPVLMFSVFGNVLSLVVFGYASSYTVLLVARIISGVCTANISVANAYIADISAPELRAKRMGIIGAAFGIGFVVGPFIGGEFSAWGMGAPAFIAAAMSVVNLFGVWRFLPESLPVEKRVAAQPKKNQRLLEVIREVDGLGTVLLVSFAQIAAFAMLEMAFSLFLNDRLQLDEKGVGRIFVYIGVVLAVVQGGMIGRLVARYGEVKLAKIGLFSVAAGMLLLPLTDSILLLLLLITPVSVGQALANPTIAALLSKRTPDHLQGMAQGLARSLGALARVIGPLMAGTLYSLYGEDLPFLVGGGMMLVVAITALFLLHDQKPLPIGVSHEKII